MCIRDRSPERDIPVVGALLAVLSVLGAFESPTVQACVPQMLSGDRLLKGNAMVNQVAAVASLIAPFLGSAAYTAFGIESVLFGAAACFGITALLERMIRLPGRPAGARARPAAILREDFSASMRFLCREQPAILKLLLLSALVSLFVAGTVVVGFPYLVRTVLGLSAAHYGAAESALGIAAILGSACVGLLAHRLRLRSLSTVFVSFGACLIPAGAAFLLPASAFARYILLLAMFCCCQFGCSIFSTCAISAIQARTPEHLMGKLMSCVFAISLCAQPLGQIAVSYTHLDVYKRQTLDTVIIETPARFATSAIVAKLNAPLTHRIEFHHSRRRRICQGKRAPGLTACLLYTS